MHTHTLTRRLRQAKHAVPPAHRRKNAVSHLMALDRRIARSSDVVHNQRAFLCKRGRVSLFHHITHIRNSVAGQYTILVHNEQTHPGVHILGHDVSVGFSGQKMRGGKRELSAGGSGDVFKESYNSRWEWDSEERKRVVSTETLRLEVEHGENGCVHDLFGYIIVGANGVAWYELRNRFRLPIGQRDQRISSETLLFGDHGI